VDMKVVNISKTVSRNCKRVQDSTKEASKGKCRGSVRPHIGREQRHEQRAAQA
jgi:hypothetical protein